MANRVLRIKSCISLTQDIRPERSHAILISKSLLSDNSFVSLIITNDCYLRVKVWNSYLCGAECVAGHEIIV